MNLTGGLARLAVIGTLTITGITGISTANARPRHAGDDAAPSHRLAGVVRSVNIRQRSFIVIETGTGREYNVYVPKGSEINLVGTSSFSSGHLVEVEHLAKSMKVNIRVTETTSGSTLEPR